MKISQIITDADKNILGLGDDSRMYIWDENTARWELLLVKQSEA
jgi:hypothetical protein